MRLRHFVASVLATALLAPGATAHETRDLPDAREGTALAAAFVALGAADAPPFFDGPEARLDVRVPGGRAVAAFDGEHLVVDILTSESGWFIVAIDDADERATHMIGSPALVRMHEAVGVSASAEGVATRAGSLGVFTAAPAAAHAHAGVPPERAAAATSTWGAANAWVQWQRAEFADERGAVVERTHGGAVLRFVFDADDIGSGLASGNLVHMIVFHGVKQEGVPAGPFLGPEQAAIAELSLYPARPGETVAELAALIRAMETRSGSPRDLLSVAGAIVVVAGLTLAAFALRPVGPARAVAPPTRTAPRARRVVRTLAIASLTLSSGVAMTPAIGAQGDLPPLFPPIFVAQDPCTPTAPKREYRVSAVDLDIIYNRWGDHDPQGMMYVLDENLAALRAERNALQPVLAGDQTPFPNGTQDSLITPLVIRAQLGECVVIHLTNRLDRIPPPPPEDPLGAEAPHVALPHLHGLPPVPASALPLPGPEPRRVSLHVHGLPLDPKVSGGDVAGFNPDTTVPVNATVTYRVGAVREGIHFFHDHADPTSAGVQAFPALDAAFRGGTVHGLFGALVVEPQGSRWTDAYTGAELRSGWRADVHTRTGSFREFVIFYHDPQLVARDDGEIREPMTDHGLNYRVETLSHRLFDDGDRCPPQAAVENRGIDPCADISLVYSSNVHGDPGTPIPRAYLGDPVKIRLAHAGMEEAHAHHLHGHRWQAMDGDPSSTRIDSQTLTPSETFTETLEAGAGGEGIAHAPGDYIFHCHLFPHLYGGMWSFFRVHDRKESDLQPLPRTNVPPPTPSYSGWPHFIQQVSTAGYRPLRAPQVTGVDPTTGLDVKAVGSPYFDICPPTAPLRKYRLAAIEVPIRYNAHGDHDPGARIFVLAEDADAILAGERIPDPPTLRMRQGECLTIELHNRLPVSGPEEPIQGVGKVSIHTHLLEYDVLGADGTSTGWIFDQTIWQNESITYRFFADRDLQTIVWHDHAAGLETAFKGIYGATLVEPAGANFLNPQTGSPIYNFGANAADRVYDSSRDPVTGQLSSLWKADIVGPGFKDFREFFSSVQDFANLRNATGVIYRDQISPVDFADFGLMAFNLRSEPLWHRLGNGSAILNSSKDVFSSKKHGDPATNVWEAYAGDRTIIRWHQVAYEEIHSVQLQGHRWLFGYRDGTSQVVSEQAIGISEAFNAYLDCGAGGCARAPGDYLYRGGAIDDVWAGGWGLFRVHGEQVSSLRPLPDADPRVVTSSSAAGSPCPPFARLRHFNVVALEKELPYNGYGDHDMRARVFVLEHEVPLVREGLLVPKPLTLRVHEGDCVKIHLKNELPEWSLSHAHADPQPTAGFLMNRKGPELTTGNLLRRDSPEPSNHVALSTSVLSQKAPGSSGNVGYNPENAVPPGGSRTYTYYADIPAPGAAFVEDMGDVLQNRHHGLFGAIVVLPRNMAALDPFDGLRTWNDVIADVHILGTGGFLRGWRDIVVFNQNGLALADPLGVPVALPGAHTADIDPLTAAQIALAGLRDLVPGGATRANLTDVAPGPHGYLVKGALEGKAFAADVHQREGFLVETVFAEPSPAIRARVTDAAGVGIPGLPMKASWEGAEATSVTDALGKASLSILPPRGRDIALRFPSIEADAFPTWSGSERSADLHLRVQNAGGIVTAQDAGAKALAIVRSHHLPAGPLGLAAIDVTGSPWRVSLGDAIRTYHLSIDPVSGAATSFTMLSRALPFGNPSVVSEADAARTAKLFVRHHFGSDEEVLQANLSRFGTWHIALGRAGSATDVGVDGVTGRILFLRRGAASALPMDLADTGRGLLRFRSESGASLDGATVEILRGATLLHTGTLDHGGRFVLPESVRGNERGTGLSVKLPAHGIDFPLALAPDGELFADVHGVGSTTPVGIGGAIQAARGALEGLAGGPSAHLQARYGVAGVLHAGDGWRVLLASRTSLARFDVDDRTGAVTSIVASAWATPKDDCSGEIPEHNGPHPTRSCMWSYSGQDEEDQGLHAYNYRAEPLEGRFNRVPDPGLAFSSHAHGENGVEIWRANVGDKITMHVIGANDKARATAFSVSGHAWPREPRDPRSTMSQGQGGVVPGSVHLIDPYGGAGGGSPLDGDFLVQGAVQRQTAESGEWALLRAYDAREGAIEKLLASARLPHARAASLSMGSFPSGVPVCSNARGSATATIEPAAGGAHKLVVRDWPALPPGRDVPVALKLAAQPGTPLAVVDLQGSATDAILKSIAGGPVNTRHGGEYCLTLDTTSVTSRSSLQLDAFGDLDGDGERETFGSAQPLRLAAGGSPAPTPAPSPTPIPTSPGTFPPPTATPTSKPTLPTGVVPTPGGSITPTTGTKPSPATNVVGSPSPTPTPDGGSKGIPAPTILFALVALVLVALLRRPPPEGGLHHRKHAKEFRP